ncbi:MAG: cytochrome c [Steroidobacteraceae bacterium]|nr:cytochrome c [Steroidobacteraceae bacterium]
MSVHGRPLASSVLLVLAALPAGLGAAEPKLTARQEQGQALYRSTCLHCHGERVWGTFTLGRRLGANNALLENRTDLVRPYVEAVIRKGVGSMPPYRRTELSDAEVEAIADYLSRNTRAQ